LVVARIRFDFPYQLLQLHNETKKFVSALYHTDPFDGLEDSPLIPKDLWKSLNIILSAYPEIDRFQFYILFGKKEKQKLRENTISTLFIGRAHRLLEQNLAKLGQLHLT
jgi:hypothetical protein